MTPKKDKNPNAEDNRPHPEGKLPAVKTLHNEIVTLRLVLKSAMRRQLIPGLPDLSAPFRRSGKISHRPWFSPAEYKDLYKATRKYAKEAPPHIRWSAEQIHDYVLFMANTGLRPDEAANLQHRDVEIVHDEDTDETILVIEVIGNGKASMLSACIRRIFARPVPSPLKTNTSAKADPASRPASMSSSNIASSPCPTGCPS